MSLENVLQWISILVFLGGGITFFFKTGAYKSNIDTQIMSLKRDVDELKKENKEIEKQIIDLKTDTDKIITNLNTTLTEIKTKLELLIQYSGFFNGNNKTQK